MRTIEFDGKERIVRDWLELTGADWKQLIDALGRLNNAELEEFGEIVDELIRLLAPDHLTDSQEWSKEARIQFLLEALPDERPFTELLQPIRGAVERVRHKDFLDKVSAWVGLKD
jgi:hypothetical protein